MLFVMGCSNPQPCLRAGVTPLRCCSVSLCT